MAPNYYVKSRAFWLPADTLILLCTFCSGKDLFSLICTCKELQELLTCKELDETIWKGLYTTRCSRHIKRVKPPRFPNAQNWRMAYLRAELSLVLLRVQSLNLKKKYTIVVPRETSLYGLKREIRLMQLQDDGVEMEDFELIDVETGNALGLQGNDLIPPSDLGFLFVSRENLLQSRRAARMISNILNTDYGPAWRKTLSPVADGLELCQVFVTATGNLKPEHVEPLSQEIASVNKLTTLLNRMEAPKDSNNAYWSEYKELQNLLAYTNNNLGYNAHKLYWNGQFHPLLHVAFSLNRRIPLRIRISALISLVWIFVRELLRPRFMANIVIRALISNGFLMTFSRLLLRLIPLLIRTQLKQIIDAEIDWVPVLFAIRFSLKVGLLTLQSYLPVAVLQAFHSSALLLLRLFVTKESVFDSYYVSFGFLASEMLLFRRKQRELKRSLGYMAKPMPLNTPASRMRFLYQKGNALFAVLRSSLSIQYALSDLLWTGFESQFDPAMTISIPVYAYAIPFFITMCLVRIRMSISDSYYCVLYL